MNILDLLAPAGAALALGSALAYLAYTLGGIAWLAPWLLAPRRVASALALVLALGGLALRPGWASAAAASVTVLTLGYAWQRQWLLPRPGPRAVPFEGAPPGDTPVLVLPGARALPLGWVRRNRLVFCGDLVIVQCGIARSLAVFTAPGSGPPLRHVLPHPTGFFVGNGDAVWDGVDGHPLRGGAPSLQRHPAWVTTYARFQIATEHGRLFGAEDGALPASPKVQRPRVPGARGIEDPMAWGVVDEHGWRPFDETGPDQTAPFGATSPYACHYLARWAARGRHVPGA